MARKAQRKTQPAARTRDQRTRVDQNESSTSNLFDYFRLGESYTSLILGIVVVIVATVLLLSFVHKRNGGITPPPASQMAYQQTQQNGTVDNQAAAVTATPTPVPTQAANPTATPKPTITAVPTTAKKVAIVATTKPTHSASSGPTAAPTTKPTVKPTAAPTAKPTAKPTVVAQNNAPPKVAVGGTYTVAANDNLWTIAEKTYRSGYNWVDIAQANKLADPSDIHVGDKLTLPKVAPKVATVGTGAQNALPTVANAITGNTYTIVHGDTLWSIAVRAYGDGYQWPKLAQANKLTNNPGLIHAGNTLTIPRG